MPIGIMSIRIVETDADEISLFEKRGAVSRPAVKLNVT